MKLAAFALAVSGLLSSIQSAWAAAFLLSNGAFTTFNVPGAKPGTTVAEGINNSGQIVGFFDDNTGRHGFLETNGIFTTIDFPGSAFTETMGINDAGQIVGLFGGSPQAFLDSNGLFSLIAGPPSGASGINSAGQIVGSLGLGERPFVYTNGNINVITLPFSDVNFSEGHGINDSGQVVGVYFPGRSTPGAQGFLDRNGVFSSINVPGATGTYSYGINNSNQIVGFFSETTSSQRQISHGYLYTSGLFTTIDVPGAIDTVANGINGAGQIVGSFTQIPEPASLVLVACGLMVLNFLIRPTWHNIFRQQFSQQKSSVNSTAAART